MCRFNFKTFLGFYWITSGTLGDSKLDSTGEGIRVNVGLTKRCFADIDRLIESSGLFNSRSDFIACALRFLVSRYVQVSDSILKVVDDGTRDSKTVAAVYRDRMEKVGAGLEERFIRSYGGDICVQVAIRLKPGFYNTVTSLTELSPRGIQHTCRMAVVEYSRYIGEEICQMHELMEDFEKYSTEEPQKEDETDLMSLWDAS